MAEGHRTASAAQRNPAVASHSEVDAGGSQRAANCRPGGSKAAREEHRVQSSREGALYAQAEATRTMAAAQMRKAELLEEKNMLLLMTMPDDRITTHEAREYLRLRRGDELKKLRRKLAEEEERERLATPLEVHDIGPSSAAKRRRQGEEHHDFGDPEPSQRRSAAAGHSQEAANRSGDGGQRGSTSLPEDGDGDDVASLSQSQGG
jgi:hypothetical protein